MTFLASYRRGPEQHRGYGWAERQTWVMIRCFVDFMTFRMPGVPAVRDLGDHERDREPTRYAGPAQDPEVTGPAAVDSRGRRT